MFTFAGFSPEIEDLLASGGKSGPPRHSSPCGGCASLNQIVAVTLEFRFQGKNRSLARSPKA